MVTVLDVIIRLNVLNIESRLTKLRDLSAPDVVIARTDEILNNWKQGNVSVKGLARKYKVSDCIVTKLFQSNAKGCGYNGKYDTVVLKMVLSDGETFYYDYHENKIGKGNDLSVNVSCLNYEEIQL